ncbi:hypothetical protein C8R46DRAFT_1026381 [Mycena filopes]|nr:hypothetical protein C8R46DRAFT_1026381 [Mycena filopes]
MIIKSAVGEVFLREVAYPYGLESIGKQFMSAELAHYGTQNCRIPIDKTWVEDIRRNYKNISRAAELRISESGSKKIVFEFHFDSTPGLERRMKSQTGSTKGNSSRVSHQSSTGPYLTASEDDKQKQRADREARAKKRASSDRESAQSETREERATRRAGEKARAEVLDSGSDSNTPLDESDDVQEDDEENDEKGDERDIESPLSDIPESRARTVDLVNNSEIKAEGSPPDEPPTAPPSSQTPSMEDIEQSSEKSSSGRAGTSGNEEVSKRKRDDSESEADGEIDIYALLRRKNELEQAKAARATNKMRREKLNQKCHKLTQKVQKRVRILENEQNDSLEKENEAQLLEGTAGIWFKLRQSRSRRLE